MAHAVTSPPMLRLKRSAQSGQKVMAAAWGAVYSEFSAAAFFFAGARIDLTPMIAGDIVEVRLLAQLTETGALTEIDTLSYSGARPSSRYVSMTCSLANVYGVEVSMRQTAGALQTFTCEFFDAKRIGIESG